MLRKVLVRRNPWFRGIGAVNRLTQLVKNGVIAEKGRQSLCGIFAA
jgi:hypothetical protein